MPNTVTIAATKANTVKTIEYSLDGGTTWQDANVFTAVPAGTLTVGQVKARLKTSNPAIVATWDGAVVVSGTAPATPTTLAVTPTNQQYNGRAEANNGGTRYFANTVFSVLTDAASLTLNVYGYNPSPYALPAAYVLVGATDLGSVGAFAAGTTGAQTYTVALPGTGMRQVDFYSTTHLNVQSLDPFASYVSLVSAVVPAGASGSIVPVTTNATEIVYVLGDSTTQAGGHGDAAFSWPRYLNRVLRPNCDIYNTGHSSMVGGRQIDSAAKRTAVLDNFIAVAGSRPNKIFWYDAMVNDVYYNAFTPAALKQIYLDFAAQFLAAVPDGQLYFKSAIPRSDESNNGLGFSLAAYRDAMQQAVTGMASTQVRYADGTQLQQAQYLADGTHVTQAGDVYVAGTINAVLNRTVASGALTQVNAVQEGLTLRASTDTTAAVQYRFNGGAFQSSPVFTTPVSGPAVLEARLLASPYTVVTNSLTLSPLLFGHSADVTLVGAGWTRNNAGASSEWYTSSPGSYYEFQFSGAFQLYHNRQSNIPEFTVSVNDSATKRISLTTFGTGSDIVKAYTSPDYGPGVHTARIQGGSSTAMNLFYLQLTALAPAAAFVITKSQSVQVDAGNNAYRSLALAGTGAAAKQWRLRPSGGAFGAWQDSGAFNLNGVPTGPCTVEGRLAATPATVVSKDYAINQIVFANNAPNSGAGWAVYPPTEAPLSCLQNSQEVSQYATVVVPAGHSYRHYTRRQPNIPTMVVSQDAGVTSEQVALAGAPADYGPDMARVIDFAVPAPVGGRELRFYRSPTAPAVLVGFTEFIPE